MTQAFQIKNKRIYKASYSIKTKKNISAPKYKKD